MKNKIDQIVALLISLLITGLWPPLLV